PTTRFTSLSLHDALPIWIHGKRACNGDALALAARELGRIGFRLVRKADAVKQLARLFLRRSAAHSAQFSRSKRDVVQHAHMREQDRKSTRLNSSHVKISY